jgi:hypothetical protein
MMTPNLKKSRSDSLWRRVGWSAVVLLVAASWQADRWSSRGDEPSSVISTASHGRRSSSLPVRSTIDMPADVLRHREPTGAPDKIVDLFRPHAWFLAAAPVPQEMAPLPRPVAPPMPYRLVGRFKNALGEDKWFVTLGSNLDTLETGKVLNSTYRVDSIGQREVVVIYLPLNERQVIALPIGEP